jgi:polyhydroxyalkanoate synthase
MLVAHLTALGDHRIRSATLLNTLVDFTEAGELIAFTDATSVRNLQRKMARRGYLDSADMSRTFTLLRANDLIWNYVGSNWLMGEDPPAFEILAWNEDGTRMPGKMHSFYLETCYLQNQLARGVMDLGGTRLDLSQVDVDFYVLSAREDHIAPWLAGYKTPKLVGGHAEFVLTSSGHIAGIVNPPSPKRSYWKARNGLPEDPGQFLVEAEEHKGSWWEDWARWAESRGGARRDPPPLGSERHPPLEDAPGTYVREK